MQIDFLPVADSVFNNLLVDINTFADIACMGGRAFGVYTECDPCDYDLTLCLRKHLIDNLIKAQEILERRIGYAVTERYHTQEILWNPSWPTGKYGVIRFQGDWPGVELVNVTQTYTALVALDDTPIEFILLANIPLTPAGTYCIGELDSTIIDNPRKVILQDAAGKTYTQSKQAGFPRINVSGNWEIAIDRSDDPSVCAEMINAYHCHLVYADITPPACTGEIVPVYPGTEQRIPTVKTESLVGGDVRYWFSVWELVKPAFQGETVRVDSGEYYKLYQSISFSCVTETESLPAVTCYTGADCTTTVEVTDGELSIFDAKNGIFEICFPTGVCGETGCRRVPDRIQIAYKTNPDVLGYAPSLVESREAIVYWAAANLPLSSCDCKVEKGFIKEAQKAYTQSRINPLSGEVIHNFEYGDLHGQVVFSERVEHLPRYAKLLLI